MDLSTPILERLLALHPRRIDLSLGRIERLLERLGHPEQRLPPVVHVAGTNGKGSVIAFMRAILEAGGKRVHTYTSPHLVSFRERIRIGAAGGGRLVTDDELADALSRAERANDGEVITFFEITTAAAFVIFSESPADVLLLETGLGGRLDATNVVERPLATTITPIGLDHQSFLGETLEEIAGEKAGILKQGSVAVSAPQKDPARTALLEVARRRDVRLLMGGQDWSVYEEHGRMVIQDEDGLLDLPAPRLAGRHQLVNAGTAIMTLRAAGIAPPAAAMESGLDRAFWPARLQRITKGPLVDLAPPGSEIWVDGGHNGDAAEAISTFMADLEERVPRPLFLIAGMLTSKDPEPFFQSFAGLARHCFTLAVPDAEATFSAAELARVAEGAQLPAEPVASLKTAFALIGDAWRFERSPRILVCGSLYLAGHALALSGETPS